jgi:hypothetical protein
VISIGRQRQHFIANGTVPLSFGKNGVSLMDTEHQDQNSSVAKVSILHLSCIAFKPPLGRCLSLLPFDMVAGSARL